MATVIDGLIKKSDMQVLSDGTVEAFFRGRVTAAERDQIEALAHRERDTRKSRIYSGYDFVVSWAAEFGVTRSTLYTVKFSYHDYTLPILASQSE